MKVDLFDIYRRAVMHRTAPSRKEALDWFVAELKKNNAAIDTLAGEYFERKSRIYWQTKGDHGKEFTRIGYIRSDRAAMLEHAESTLASMKANILGKLLMDMELPNGKMLRFSTGAECDKAGGFYTEVARHIKPAQVVDKHLSEADLQNIRARYFQVNAAITEDA